MAANRPTRAWAVLERAVNEPTGAPDDDDKGLELLYRATQLAAQYGRVSRALTWIRQDRERRRERATGTNLHDAIELGVHWVTKDEEGIRKILHRLSWDELPVNVWSENLRLALILDNHPSADVLASIERHDDLDALPDTIYGGGDETSPYHRANRLRLLGFFFFERGQLRKSLRYFRAAAHALTGNRTLDGRLKRIEIYGHWGKAAFREGKLEASERHLRNATRIAARLRHQIWYDTYRLELAYILSHRGDTEGAEKIARGVARRQVTRKTPNGLHRFLYMRSLLVAGHCAVDAHDHAKGRHYARKAARAHRRHAIPRLHGYLYLLRGRVAALGTSEHSEQRAREAFDRAETIFAAFGDSDLPGLLRLAVYRGDLHIARGQLSEALGETVRCVELTRRHGFLPARAAGLLLTSQLLLQNEVPGADRLYEEVLRDLGAIHDHVVLFRVIANLYLYSWNLDDKQLDLTDWHLNQIHEMQKLLRPETFHRLYERYVTRPVARRLLTKTFGLDPDDI